MSDDLTAFATARLDEDEALARACPPLIPVHAEDFGAEGDGIHDDTAAFQAAVNAAGFGQRYDPARALREVEAGRRILARHGYCDHGGWNGTPLCPDLADLLVRWAGHPGYSPEWKP